MRSGFLHGSSAQQQLWQRSMMSLSTPFIVRVAYNTVFQSKGHITPALIAAQPGSCSSSVSDMLISVNPGLVADGDQTRRLGRTFHFSMSSCLVLYCFASSTRTLFMLSELDCSCGSTSPTVRSTSTPLIMRKHLRDVGRGVRVSRTSLRGGISTSCIGIVFYGSIGEGVDLQRSLSE
jgi:hypothetical protein